MRCCDMSAAMLREPVEFQRQVHVPIGGGAKKVEWQPLSQTKGFMRPVSGGERLYAERLDAETRNRLTIRYRADLVESDRAIIRGRAYQIRFINNLEFRNRWLELDLDGGVAQ